MQRRNGSHGNRAAAEWLASLRAALARSFPEGDDDMHPTQRLPVVPGSAQDDVDLPAVSP